MKPLSSEQQETVASMRQGGQFFRAWATEQAWQRGERAWPVYGRLPERGVVAGNWTAVCGGGR
jgi:hypothetical protein